MSDLVFEFDDGQALADLTSLKKRGLPTVAVFLTGRPLWVNPHINLADAFVVGWLPGTQGAGVADVLAADQNGNPVYDFTGRLSFSWPSDGSGRPIAAKSKSGVQFPFGYGLNYKGQPAKMASLSEDAGVDAPNGAFTGEIMARGRCASSFQHVSRRQFQLEDACRRFFISQFRQGFNIERHRLPCARGRQTANLARKWTGIA